MRTVLALAALVLGAAPALAAVDARPPAGAPVVTAPPRAYAGYSQPGITDCATRSPTLRECTVPAMTAGRYLIEAAAGATSTAAGATQALQIRVGGTPCIGTKFVPFTGHEGLRLGCVVNFLTDNPIVVAVAYEAKGGTPDAKGPEMVFRPIPWNGVIEARGLVFHARPAAAPAKK